MFASIQSREREKVTCGHAARCDAGQGRDTVGIGCGSQLVSGIVFVSGRMFKGLVNPVVRISSHATGSGRDV